jgi:hypothetical protein
MAATLDESSDLAAGVVRLHEIKRAYERHQDFSPRRFIVQAHPEFSGALDEFRARWASAYDEARNRIYKREAPRVSDEFLRCYRILIERTGDDPMGLGMACRSFRRIWPMLELRVPRQLFPPRLPTHRLWSPWLHPSGLRTLRLCEWEVWWRFRSWHGRGLPRRRRAPLDAPISDIPRVVFPDYKRKLPVAMTQEGKGRIFRPRWCGE